MHAKISYTTPPKVKDEEMIALMRHPEQARKAFEQLYRQVYPQVRRVIRSMGGHDDDARDMFQEGVIAVWRHAQMGTYEAQNGARLSSFLIEICKRRWLDIQKKASSRYERPVDSLPEIREDPAFLVQWQAHEERLVFHQRFRLLGRRCQELLTRYYFERQSLDVIADALAIGKNAIKNEKYRCMQRLRKILSDRNHE